MSCIFSGAIVLDTWDTHPKGHKCHKFDVTQMFWSLHSHLNIAFGQQKEIKIQTSFAHGSHHITGSCLQNNACVQLIILHLQCKNTAVLMGFIVDAIFDKTGQPIFDLLTLGYLIIHHTQEIM